MKSMPQLLTNNLPKQDIDDVFSAFYKLEGIIDKNDTEDKTYYVLAKLVTIIEQFFRCIVQFQIEDHPTLAPENITLASSMIEEIIKVVNEDRKITTGFVISFSYSFQNTWNIEENMKLYGFKDIFLEKNELDKGKYDELFNFRHRSIHTIDTPIKNTLELVEYHRMVEILMKHMLDRYENVNIGRSFYVLKGYAINEADHIRVEECFEEVLKCYDLMLKQKQHVTTTYMNKGMVLLELDRYNEALKCFDETLKLDPNNIHALNKKGHTLFNLKQHTQALDIINNLILKQPDDIIMYYNKGLVLYESSNLTKALEIINIVISRDASHADAYILKAKILLKNNKYDEALECLNKILSIYPDDYESQNFKSEILEKLKQKDF